MAKAVSIFKFRPFNKPSIELLLNKELWFAKPDTLNDPFECQLSYEQVLEKTWELHRAADSYKKSVEKHLIRQLKEVGICSFSKTRQNQLMWSHYSDEHRGLCIGFNKKILTPKNRSYNSIDVKYQAELPYKKVIERISFYQKNPVEKNNVSDIVWDIIYSIIGTKYSNWKYEREVRLIKEEFGAVKFSPRDVNSIAFGLRMPNRDKSTLRQLLSGDEWKHIKFLQAEKSPNKYGLVFEKV